MLRPEIDTRYERQQNRCEGDVQNSIKNLYETFLGARMCNDDIFIIKLFYRNYLTGNASLVHVKIFI